jgi:hypothetical protein
MHARTYARTHAHTNAHTTTSNSKTDVNENRGEREQHDQHLQTKLQSDVGDEETGFGTRKEERIGGGCKAGLSTFGLLGTSTTRLIDEVHRLQLTGEAHPEQAIALQPLCLALELHLGVVLVHLRCLRW